MKPLGAAYGRVAALRRAWYARHPDRQHRLDVPVVSVGNLVVGGSGKTPVVAAVARLLQGAGAEPPSGRAHRAGSLDAFLTPEGENASAPTGDEEGREDLEAFNAWLEGLKK